MFNLSNLFIPAILFFALGFISRLIRSDLKFPPDLAKALSIYLLVGIGLHGGMELAHSPINTALDAIGVALLLGFGLPLIAYAILIWLVRIDALNASAIAAHYGSVSAGTFLTAIAYLKAQGISYESYPVIMLAVMESPAIIVGLLLAKFSRRVESNNIGAATGGNGEIKRLLHEAVTNGSVVLLFGSMLIGVIASPTNLAGITPFFTDIFMGALCLFLLEMGMDAARRLDEFRHVGLFLLGFGIAMPIIGGAIGVFVGHSVLALSIGGAALVGVLGASASYIAVPPAMRLAIPEANPSFYLTLSLGVTFPFNVLVGIPLYFHMAKAIAGV
jgi:hypothetical protein